jgi:hypothetical protein
VSTHAIFIPHEEVQLSAVVVLPDGPPAGVAIFPLRTPQLGVAANVFWAEAAARLATRSVATVRFEYAGSGDSTGPLALGLAAIADPVRETLAVADFAMAALGLKSFMTAGSCYNAAVALQAANAPHCTACVSIDPPSLDPGGPGRIRRAGASWRVVDAIRVRPGLRRVLLYDTVRRLLRDGMGSDVQSALERSSGHARVLLIDDSDLETRGIADEPGAYEVVRDISFGLLRVDAVELDEGEERVLELLVDWLAGPESLDSNRSRGRDRAALGG